MQYRPFGHTGLEVSAIGVAKAVALRGVKTVDAEIERTVKQTGGFVLWGTAITPRSRDAVVDPDLDGAERDLRNLEVRSPQPSCPQQRILCGGVPCPVPPLPSRDTTLARSSTSNQPAAIEKPSPERQ